MFNLPNQVIRTSRKSPIKEYLNHTEEKKRPNINQIKEEIQSILKRNNSPLYMTVNRQSQKSQKSLTNLQTLQRKKSKILVKNTDQYIEMAKNNRKNYEEFLIGNLASKSHSKQIITIKQNLQTLKMKSTSYYKDGIVNFATSKSNFKSYRTIHHNQKSKNVSENFGYQQIGLGKILFSKDANVKFRKINLLSPKTSLQSKDIFKRTVNQTFYKVPNLDYRKYFKPRSQSILSNDVKQIQKEQEKQKQKSFEVFKMQIGQKQTNNSSELNKKNYQLPKISTKQIKQVASFEQTRINFVKSERNTFDRPKQRLQTLNRTLNVIDDELLVYYGKLKKRKFNIIQNEHDKKPYIKQLSKKIPNLISTQVKKFMENEIRSSRQLKKEKKQQYSWGTNHLDPWQKAHLDLENQNQNIFQKIEDNNMNTIESQVREIT